MAYAQTLTDLQRANTITPTLGTFDESKGVAGRVSTMTSQGSPLMETARTRAKQKSAASGLMNSSIAAQAGEQAVIETATPIANADANLYQQQGLTNQQASNNAATQNANNALTAGVQGSQMDVSQDQASKSLMEQARQFNTNTAQRDSQFGVTSGQQQQQISNQNAQFGTTAGQQQQQISNQREQFGVTAGQRQQEIGNQSEQFGVTARQRQEQIGNQSAQFDREVTEKVRQFDSEMTMKSDQFRLNAEEKKSLLGLDHTNKLALAEVEARFKNQIQGSANITNAWAEHLKAVAAAQGNPNLEGPAKDILIKNSQDQFQAFASFWNKATGGKTDISDLLAVQAAPSTQPAGPSGPGTGRTADGKIDANNNGYADEEEDKTIRD